MKNVEDEIIYFTILFSIFNIGIIWWQRASLMSSNVVSSRLPVSPLPLVRHFELPVLPNPTFWERVRTRVLLPSSSLNCSLNLGVQSTVVTNKEIIIAFLSTFLLSKFMDCTFLLTSELNDFSIHIFSVMGWNCL